MGKRIYFKIPIESNEEALKLFSNWIKEYAKIDKNGAIYILEKLLNKIKEL